MADGIIPVITEEARVEQIILETVKNGGPSAIIVGIGYLVLNGKIDNLAKMLDKLCILRHTETDRRIGCLEKKSNEEKV